MATMCVVYRVGGTDRFSWRRAGPYMTRDQASAGKAKIERAGYVALAPQDWKTSHAVGLPATFRAGENPADFETRGEWIYRVNASLPQRPDCGSRTHTESECATGPA